MTKPKFEELTTMTLPDVGLRFNAQKVGPTTFKGLRNANYGKEFRMPTMPELVPLVSASLENKNYDTAKNVIKTIRNHGLAGNTGILYVPEGMFAEDIPKTKIGISKIFMNQKVLEKRLGSHEEKGVVFSDDKSVRFTPYNFKRKSQTPLELSTNTGIIALVGGEENAEKLAKASEHYRTKPYFLALESVYIPITKVAGLCSAYFGGWLGVYAGYNEGDGNRCSFGVQKIKQEADLKK
jgi:hypothetical protein